MYCSHCGSKLAEGALFCSSCGNKVGSSSSPSAFIGNSSEAMLFRKLWTIDNGYIDGCYYKKNGIFQKRTQVHVRIEDVDAVCVEEEEMSVKKRVLLIVWAVLVALLLTPLVLILLAILIAVSGGFCRYRFVLMVNGQDDIRVPLNQKEVEKARVFARCIERERNARVDGR